MHDNFTNEKSKAVLISLITPEMTSKKSESSAEELERLADTAGIEVFAKVSQSKMTPDTATYIGTGKLEEVKAIVNENDIDFVIIDDEISPTQIKNIEDIIGGSIEVFDRTMLILEIFATHANTAEGKLQVEIARMKYTMPRLLGRGKEMSRLGGTASGGMSGARGAGETKLELDRRDLKTRINNMEKELEKLEQSRNIQRRGREKSGIKNIAIAGYTNSGKSTLLNYLTNAGILTEDKLFATLDPTTRKLLLPGGETVLVTDTVGLIRKLPHHLVNAFKSTLDEITFADVILLVADISDSECEEQINVSRELFAELGVSNIPIIIVYNKIDKIVDAEKIPIDNADAVFISSLNGTGIHSLILKIQQTLEAERFRLNFLFPFANQAELNALHKSAKIIDTKYLETATLVKAAVDSKVRGLLARFIIDDSRAEEIWNG